MRRTSPISSRSSTEELEHNLLQLQSLVLEFNNVSESTLQFTFMDGSQSPVSAVGLDGVYRLTPGVGLDRAIRTKVETAGQTVGMRATWSDRQTFLIDYDTITNRYAYQLQLHIEDQGVTLVATDRINGSSITIHGVLQNP